MPELPSVLLVNDYADERDMYAEGLRMYGYSSLSASTADAAFRVVEEQHPIVVITDVTLGDHSSGFELTRRLKAEERTRAVPVIILTGRVYESDRQAGAQAGCDLFLKKPCLPGALAKEIRLLLERSQALRAQASEQQARARLARARADRALSRSQAIAERMRSHTH